MKKSTTVHLFPERGRYPFLAVVRSDVLEGGDEPDHLMVIVEMSKLAGCVAGGRCFLPN